MIFLSLYFSITSIIENDYFMNSHNSLIHISCVAFLNTMPLDLRFILLHISLSIAMFLIFASRLEDDPRTRLNYYFDPVADKIKEVQDRGGRTLLHCVAGVSRSASLTIAYLIKHKGKAHTHEMVSFKITSVANPRFI